VAQKQGCFRQQPLGFLRQQNISIMWLLWQKSNISVNVVLDGTMPC
jgi:hypothetical protein